MGGGDLRWQQAGKRQRIASSSGRGVARSQPPRFPPAGIPKRRSRWGTMDAEVKRQWRVAAYRAYAVEGKVKVSLCRGVRWIKRKCSHLIHGW